MRHHVAMCFFRSRISLYSVAHILAPRIGVKSILDVAHGVENAYLWLDAAESPSSGIRRYKPDEGKDKGLQTLLSWEKEIDPSAKSLAQSRETQYRFTIVLVMSIYGNARWQSYIQVYNRTGMTGRKIYS